MFLGCQKIEYGAKHCSIAPKKKGIFEDLAVLGKTSSCSCRTGNNPKLQMKEEEYIVIIGVHVPYIF
jgi:hypothetical protein